MTLLELTVVILVLLTLVSVLFIGARAWKKGADRAACILNIRNIQSAVRSWSNMYGREVGDAMSAADIIGAGLFVEKTPVCPSGGTYDMSGLSTVLAVGSLGMTCSLSAAPDSHVPADYAGW